MITLVASSTIRATKRFVLEITLRSNIFVHCSNRVKCCWWSLMMILNLMILLSFMIMRLSYLTLCLSNFFVHCSLALLFLSIVNQLQIYSSSYCFSLIMSQRRTSILTDSTQSIVARKSKNRLSTILTKENSTLDDQTTNRDTSSSFTIHHEEKAFFIVFTFEAIFNLNVEISWLIDDMLELLTNCLESELAARIEQRSIFMNNFSSSNLRSRFHLCEVFFVRHRSCAFEHASVRTLCSTLLRLVHLDRYCEVTMSLARLLDICVFDEKSYVCSVKKVRLCVAFSLKVDQSTYIDYFFEISLWRREIVSLRSIVQCE